MQSACRNHAFGVDDTEKPNPAAPTVRDDALYVPISTNAVPDLEHFWRVQVDHSSLAPKFARRARINGTPEGVKDRFEMRSGIMSLPTPLDFGDQRSRKLSRRRRSRS